MTTLEKLKALLPTIHVSVKSLLLNDCPQCNLPVNRSFVDNLTMEIQDEYRKKVESLLPKMIEVVREDVKAEIAEKVRSIRGCPLPDTYSEDDDVIDKNDVLELLK